MGARTLRIEANNIIEKRIASIIEKRYNAIVHHNTIEQVLLSDGWLPLKQHIITISLKAQNPTNTSAKVLQKMNLRSEAKITDKIFAFTRNEQGAGRGFGKVLSFEERAVTLGDLGITSGKVKRLDGTISNKDGIMKIAINDIEGKFPNHPIERVIGHLIRTAKEGRAKTLIIEGNDVINPNLKKILSKRYKAVKISSRWNNKYTVTIPLE
jgi:hypothetical protein